MDDAPKNSPTLTLPAMEDLAVQTVQRLAADGYTSSVMKLPAPVLNELARRLAAPGVERPEVLEWLNAKAEGGLIKRTNFYRFDQRFREVLKQVIGGHAARMMVAKLSAQPEFQTADLQRLIKNQVTTLVAQEVMTAGSPEDIDTSRLNAILSMVMAADKGELEAAKLALATKQAEDRAAKLEAEVAKMRLDIEERERKLRQAVEAAKEKLNAKVKAGGELTREDVFAMVDSVVKGEAA